jgi:fluoroquinolone transport system permease protein
VRSLQILRALGPIDLKSVRRDSMLRWLAAYPIAIALLLRWGVPALNQSLATRADIDLVPYYVLLASLIVVAVPTVTGMVIGFLLLDQRDDDTLTALQVTPLSLASYLAYRVAVPMLLSIVMVAIAVPLSGLVEVGVAPLLAVAVCGAPLAPLSALFLGAFAKNKVQGFALAKGGGVLVWGPILGYFVDSRWQLAFGIAPHYWPAKMFWMTAASEPGAWLCFLVGVSYELALLGLLLRRYKTVIRA